MTMSDFEVLPIGTKARLELAETRLAQLAEHVSGHITFARDRIQDGVELGANVWRIALEDIVRENTEALEKAGQRQPLARTDPERAAA